MNWNVSAWAIRNPVPPLLCVALLVLAGLFAFGQLPILRYPNIDTPVISVAVSDGTAAPTEIETQITTKVEDAISAVAGIRHINSTVTTGLSSTSIEFRIGTDTIAALNDVKNAIATIRSALPSTIDEPLVQLENVHSHALRSYGATSASLSPEQLSWFLDDVVLRELRGMQGVGRVDRVGGADREIQLRLDPDRLIALKATASGINQQLSATTVDLPGGQSEIGGQQQTIRTLAAAPSVEALSATPIALSGGRRMRLGDLGRVVDTVEEPTTFASLDGKPIVALSVFTSAGASDVSVAADVDARLQDLAQRYPQVRFSEIGDTVAYTYGNYRTGMDTLYEGAALAVLVVLLFLRDWRATLIAASALPLSAIPTFWVISLLGFSLNIISLLAITLATGILVDDAIVEIENVVRHIRMGRRVFEATLDATQEIGLAVIAISLTIMAIFLPVSFMTGIAGQYFKQFGLTVAIAVFFSLLVARFITPILAAFLMREPRQRAGSQPERTGIAARYYGAVLGFTLRRGMRWLVLIAGIAIFALSAIGMTALPSDFVPEADQNQILLSLELPPGASLDNTAATTTAIATALKRVPEVQSVFVMGGTSAADVAEPRRANLVVSLVPKAERQRSQRVVQESVAAWLEQTPDIRFSFDNQETVALVGQDGTAVGRAAADLQLAMSKDPLFVRPMVLSSFASPELRILPRLDLASDLGTTPTAISDTIRFATGGPLASETPKFTVDGRQIPIRVELDRSARADLDLLAALPVPRSDGTTVPLSSVADLAWGEGPSTIDRYDRQRLVTVGFDVPKDRTPSDVTDQVPDMEAVKHFPAGVSLQASGNAEEKAQMFSQFGIAMASGILLVFFILILLFRNLFHPLAILTAMPLSLCGVVAALILSGSAFSLSVTIGLLMLMGIVTKNTIMLVDFAVERVRHGMPRSAAIVDACQKRARPILMTTVAMAAGMVPAAIGVGEGGELRAPMAIAVIGGLLASTMLSLLFIPALYTILDDASHGTARLFVRIVRPNRPASAALSTASQSPANLPELPQVSAPAR